MRTAEEQAANETKSNWDAWVQSLPVPKEVTLLPCREEWMRSHYFELGTAFELGTSRLELSRTKRESRFLPWTTEKKVYVELMSNYRHVYRATMSTAGLEKKLPELLAMMKERDEQVDESKKAKKKLQAFYEETESFLKRTVEMGYLKPGSRWSLQKNHNTELGLTCTLDPASFTVPIPLGRTLTLHDADKLLGREVQLVELVKLLDNLSKPL